MSDIRQIGHSDFEEFGKRIGLPPKVIKQDIDTFAATHPLANELLERSFLSEDLKKQYRQAYEYRRKMLSF